MAKSGAQLVVFHTGFRICNNIFIFFCWALQQKSGLSKLKDTARYTGLLLAPAEDLMMLFWPILDHFWCPVVTLITFSSRQEKFKENPKKSKNFKKSKNPKKSQKNPKKIQKTNYEKKTKNSKIT